MRGVYVFLVLLSWLSLVTADDRLIPFDDFHLSVDTNWRAEKAGKGDALKVHVEVSRSAEDPVGSARTEVYCFGFDSDKREFSVSDLATLFESFNAASEGRIYQKEILSTTFFGQANTRFEVTAVGEKPVVRVSRGEAEVSFTLAEAERTREALAHAKAAEAWYRKLLTGTELPAITAEVHPPLAHRPYLTSTVGKVSGGGFAFEIRVSSWGDDEENYQVDRRIGGENQEWSAEDRVDHLIATISQAIDAGKAGETFNHQFYSGSNGTGDKISVTVNPATGKADITFKFGEHWPPRLSIATGTFGEKELKAIRQLEAEAETRRKWFEEHKSLFHVPPGGDP